MNTATKQATGAERASKLLAFVKAWQAKAYRIKPSTGQSRQVKRRADRLELKWMDRVARKSAIRNRKREITL